MLISSCQLLRGYCRNLIRCQSARYIGHKGAYEGEGKTTLTILNRDTEYGLMVDTITPYGFKLNIGLNILGPMIMFPKTVIGWNLKSPSEIDENSLALFKVLMPRPDILILGLDDEYPRDAPFLIDFTRTMKSFEMNFEVLPVDKACTTFNFLNAEKRFVVGAFLPPRKLDAVDAIKLQAITVQKVLHEPIRGIDD